MNLIEKLELMQRLDALIRRKATGTPNQLSDRLSVSRRNVFNIINTMKDMGAPIYFCKTRNSYCYEQKVTFTYGFTPKTDRLYGGKNYPVFRFGIAGIMKVL